MNFIIQIEAALKSINQARFQSLINHLLHVQGNTFIGAPGSVVAKEKTSKGAPDSFFVSGDKYVFVECTTLEKLGGSKSFLEKLKKDIEHCFDEEKTGIKKEKIEKIILAFTEKISAEEFDQLKTRVYNYKPYTSLEILSIQKLPMLINDFPGLSKQYLEIEIIKGEIFNLEDFLIKTTKGLQPSLTNEFVGRAEELKEALQYLNTTDILLLSGNAGVGKSKLAISILTEISKEGYIPIVIQSSAVPLWDDFVHLFQNEKNYIILFDDANKSVQNLSYLIEFLKKPKTGKLKVVITSRDYVKQQVLQLLSDSLFHEIVINKLSDKEIGEIIIKALPNLQYYPDIKRKIVDLSKGNPRVALMATYSVTPDAETNYLNSPVQLYEKYFEKIAEEIEAFSKKITLQTLAIVSFFGRLDRNNKDIKELLKKEFDLDWDELWVTILELHRNEILDVYADEVAKVSDQVLATYAFYKCFIDDNTAVIDYSKWILVFIKTHSHRIRNTLIDINNTFTYYHVKDLVTPHLDKVISEESNNEFLYSFYSLFWFYKGYDALIYLTNWVKNLSEENNADELVFTYSHNNYTTPTEYFKLLVNFWNHSNELLQPALELGIELVSKQLTRLPEFLKFINDYFTYRLEDIQLGYERQHTLLDVLLNEKRSLVHKQIATGTFINIIEKLLGWHFTETASKGIQLTIYNFDLRNSPELLELRNKILQGIYLLWNDNTNRFNKILEKIVSPGGKIDTQIYVAELPVYQKLITDKLSVKQYPHCRFVKKLAKKITSTGATIPEDWNLFINSDILKLFKLLTTEIEDRDGKGWEEIASEQRRKIQKFISAKKWTEIEYLLFLIDKLFRQQDANLFWSIEGGISEVFIAIGVRDKTEIKKALRMFFEGKISFQLQIRIIYFILNQNILKGNELLELINDYDFKGKSFWLLTLLNALPENQIDLIFVELLVTIFKESNEPIPIHRMSDFIKYDAAFNEYKNINSNLNLKQHNIISYLTEILLAENKQRTINFGFDFCRECSKYFVNHITLFKQAFIYLKKDDQNHFDYDGKEFEAVMTLDNTFLIEYLQQKVIDESYLSFRFEHFKLDFVWSLPNYNEIINKALDIIIEKSRVYSNSEHPSAVLFTFRNASDELLNKAYNLITDFINKYHMDEQRIKMIMNIALHRFKNQFLTFLRQFLLLNKDVEMFKEIWLNTGGVFTGSRVPYIQKEIDFHKEIMTIVKALPNILNYAEHIKYLEQQIIYLKKDIKREQRRDFEESFDY